MIVLLWAQFFKVESPYWYLLPLIAVVSLVYSATRHEEWSAIWHRAIRLAVFIVVFMAVTLALLWAIQVM